MPIRQKKTRNTKRLANSGKPRNNIPKAKVEYEAADVDFPLDATPHDVRKELDALALFLQKHPTDSAAFDKIHAYIHKYLLGLVFKKFNFVRGYEESDIYQEALIALFKKAIPKFNPNKGMSFLNFAKMCINRHLITILHASTHRRKDMPINQSISLDHNPSGDDSDDSCNLSNVIADEKSPEPYKEISSREAYSHTLSNLMNKLSPFEIVVLEEYLMEKSYKKVAKSISKKTGRRINDKSIDNALLRIRKKAVEMAGESEEGDVPLLIK